MKRLISRLPTERRQEDRGHGITHRMTDNTFALSGCAGLIGLSSIAVVVSRGASYHQLAIEILAAAVILFLLLSLVEVVFEVLTCLFETRLRNGASRRVGLEASRTRPTAE